MKHDRHDAARHARHPTATRSSQHGTRTVRYAERAECLGALISPDIGHASVFAIRRTENECQVLAAPSRRALTRGARAVARLGPIRDARGDSKRCKCRYVAAARLASRDTPAPALPYDATPDASRSTPGRPPTRPRPTPAAPTCSSQRTTMCAVARATGDRTAAGAGSSLPHDRHTLGRPFDCVADMIRLAIAHSIVD